MPAVNVTTLLDCGHAESTHNSITRGYGTDRAGKKHCYACCADRDRASMIETGRATLYLTGGDASDDGYALANWPGSLTFKPLYVKKGCHNVARTRYDAWFNGPDGHVWHAVQYGEETQIAHCRRTKERWQVNVTNGRPTREE